MNHNSLPKIIRMLKSTAQRPQMFTSSVETMLMRVSTLLEAADVQFSSSEFYCKHGGRDGNRYLFEIPENVSFDEWTGQVVDDAIKMIEAKHFPEKSNEAS